MHRALAKGCLDQTTPSSCFLTPGAPQVLSELTLEQKKRFLAFTTGCDRAPVGGLSQLVLTLQRSGPDSERLPTAHTCFNTLLLPEYALEERMRERMMLAIENAQGFGLK